MKTVEELYQEMMDTFARETGTACQDDCELAVRFYAVAVQIYALSVQVDWVRRQAFPQTAEGIYLDQHAALRGLERQGARRAEGVLRFGVDRSAEENRTIPTGTVCMTAGAVRFETLETGTLAAGQTWVEVRAQAMEAGRNGNVAAGTVRTMAVAPVGVAWCTNPEAFAGGVEAEGDQALRERVLETFRRMPNGANAAFYRQQAMAFDGVAACTVLPRNRGIGTVDVVVATEAGTPDEALLEGLREYLQDRREIAVDVAVLAPEEKPVEVSVQVAAAEGFDPTAVRSAVETAIRSWFGGRRLGQDLLRAQLGALVYGTPGVANYRVTTPAEDLAVTGGQLPVLGNLTVEGMA